MVSARGPPYRQGVKHKKISGVINPKAGDPSPLAADLNQKEIDLAPVPVAAARKSHSSHVAQGLSPGHEARHWLEGEAQWRAERKLARAPAADGK